MKTITKDEFIDLVSNAYAVVVNNESMQYVGGDDEDRLYIAGYDMEDITYLDRVEDISIKDNTICFYNYGVPMKLQLLDIVKLEGTLIE